MICVMGNIYNRNKDANIYEKKTHVSIDTVVADLCYIYAFYHLIAKA